MKIISVETSPFHEMPYRSSGRGETRYNNLPFFIAKTDFLPDGVDAIVALADLQGRENDATTNRLMGVAVADELKTLEELGLIPRVSMILSAGDLYDRPELNKLGATGDVTDVLNAFASNFPIVVAVNGNHDIVDAKGLVENITILDGASTTIEHLSIGGVCGITGKEPRHQRKSPENFRKALIAAMAKSPLVTMMHQTPKGELDTQIGDESTSEFLASSRKTLVIAGHCHWQDLLCSIGDCQVLNVDSRVVVITK
ncbi:metallophosphoesterase [Vibrio coralliirubri]|uniref:metallophosphoesterase family protein n=1 Tax=Vibrio coralliirubri TaxID=1516159 RepID=UPI0022852A9F|nr:metallophosphoesterase [Vibrio coralliirubri]MCY9861026.1 metallophosphoesterase [Vibrio coralliirubri]